MSRFLRKVDLRLWLEVDLDADWLEGGEVPADPVCSLDTRKNTMSVWLLDDETRTAEDVVAALAVASGHIRDFGYVVLYSDDIAKSRIDIREADGDTRDSVANKLHRDLIMISAQRLVVLTRLTLNRRIEEVCDRILAKDVAAHILKGIDGGSLTDVPQKIINDAKSLVSRRDRQT